MFNQAPRYPRYRTKDRLGHERISPVHYWPWQLTPLFQSTKAPCGLSRQAQTWSSKNELMLKRLGAPTKLKTCPSSTGGAPLAASQLAESRMNSTPTRV